MVTCSLTGQKYEVDNRLTVNFFTQEINFFFGCCCLISIVM